MDQEDSKYLVARLETCHSLPQRICIWILWYLKDLITYNPTPSGMECEKLYRTHVITGFVGLAND